MADDTNISPLDPARIAPPPSGSAAATLPDNAAASSVIASPVANPTGSPAGAPAGVVVSVAQDGSTVSSPDQPAGASSLPVTPIAANAPAPTLATTPVSATPVSANGVSAQPPAPAQPAPSIPEQAPVGPSFFGYKAPKWASDYEYVRKNQGKGSESDSDTWLVTMVDRLLKKHSI